MITFSIPIDIVANAAGIVTGIGCVVTIVKISDISSLGS